MCRVGQHIILCLFHSHLHGYDLPPQNKKSTARRIWMNFLGYPSYARCCFYFVIIILFFFKTLQTTCLRNTSPPPLPPHHATSSKKGKVIWLHVFSFFIFIFLFFVIITQKPWQDEENVTGVCDGDVPYILTCEIFFLPSFSFPWLHAFVCVSVTHFCSWWAHSFSPVLHNQKSVFFLGVEGKDWSFHTVAVPLVAPVSFFFLDPAPLPHFCSCCLSDCQNDRQIFPLWVSLAWYPYVKRITDPKSAG